MVDENYVQSFFGFPQEDFEGKSETGYILFYQDEKYNKEINSFIVESNEKEILKDEEEIFSELGDELKKINVEGDKEKENIQNENQ